MTTKRPTLSLKPRPAPSKASGRTKAAGAAPSKTARPAAKSAPRQPAPGAPRRDAQDQPRQPAARRDADQPRKPAARPAGGEARQPSVSRDAGQPRQRSAHPDGDEARQPSVGRDAGQPPHRSVRPDGGEARQPSVGRDAGQPRKLSARPAGGEARQPSARPDGGVAHQSSARDGADQPRQPSARPDGGEARQPADRRDAGQPRSPAHDGGSDERGQDAPASPWAQRGATQARMARAKPPADPGLRHSYEVKAPLQTTYRPDTLKTDSLAFALLGAANAAAMVRADGVALPQALAKVNAILDATPQARGAIQDIAYRTMRQLGRAETLLALLAPKQPDPPMLAMLLCAALVLIDVPAGTQPPYEPFTVVDQAVTAAAAHPDLVRAKGMVNAVLRRFLREKDELLAAALKNEVARYNYPQWWIDATRAAYPKDWQRILEEGNRPPPLTLRVNQRHATVAEYLERLRAAGMDATPVGRHAVRLARPVPVQQIPGFAEGVVSVQDAGAQLAAPLLDVADGMRVLDACAAPGGKTGHILEAADVSLTAVDADPARLQRVQENLDRLHLHATLTSAEAQARDWWDGEAFDRIVADVPCTASGIVRRHPDIRWLRRKSDTQQLATLSTQILDNLWSMLKPDGKLLFVTCSLWPQESEAQAAAFAARHSATRLPAPGQLLPEGGIANDHDGLFYALFQKPAG